MARAKPEPEVLPPEEIEAGRAYLDSLPVETPEEKEIGEVLAELGGNDDAIINIYKTVPGKDSRGGEFVDSVHPSVFSLPWLRDNYGGGAYRIHVRSGGQLIANRPVKIAERVKGAEVLTPVNNGGDIAKLAETMNSGFQNMAAMIAESIRAMSANQPKPKTTQEILSEMLTMKQLLGIGEQPQQQNPAQVFEMFQKGVEFARDITPREGEAGVMDVLLEAVKNFVPPIANAVMQANAQQEQAAQTAPQLSAPVQNPAPAQNTGPAVSQPQEGQDEMIMKYYVTMLVNYAKEDRDPGLYAELIADQLSDAQIADLLSKPDLLAFLASYNAEVNNNREWFEELKAALVELTKPETGASVGEDQPPQVPAQNAVHGANQQPDPDNGSITVDS